jgi:hypothetical protein
VPFADRQETESQDQDEVDGADTDIHDACLLRLPFFGHRARNAQMPKRKAILDRCDTFLWVAPGHALGLAKGLDEGVDEPVQGVIGRFGAHLQPAGTGRSRRDRANARDGGRDTGAGVVGLVDEAVDG